MSRYSGEWESDTDTGEGQGREPMDRAKTSGAKAVGRLSDFSVRGGAVVKIFSE